MERFTVVVTEPIHHAGIKLLEESDINVISLPPGSDEETLRKNSQFADALITRGSIDITRSYMAAFPKLKAVGVHGIGCDHIDLKAAKDLGKTVFNTPTALTETVAEMTLGMILALTRRIVSADKAVRLGGWMRKYTDLRGTEINGKKVGIIGLGKIGAAVAERLKPFSVKLTYYDIVRNRELEKKLGIEKKDLKTVLETSDILTLHVPYTPQTHLLISKQEIDLMKEGVYIINLARGKVIDQKALIEGLKGGKIAGAALDVFEVEPLELSSPLVSMDNVILTPHLGASSIEAMERMAVQAAQGALKILHGETPDHPVKI
jgi:D-3-phosphoglycerate dehydrogenase